MSAHPARGEINYYVTLNDADVSYMPAHDEHILISMNGKERETVFHCIDRMIVCI